MAPAFIASTARFSPIVPDTNTKGMSEARSRAQRPISGPPGEGGGVAEEIQSDLVDPGTTQDTFSIRDKNAGKGQKTADKWNQ